MIEQPSEADRRLAVEWLLKRYDTAIMQDDVVNAHAELVAAGRAEEREAWVWTWETIDEQQTYLVCNLNAASNGSGAIYLARPQLMKGWEVSRLTPKCYAAMPCPELPAAIRSRTT